MKIVVTSTPACPNCQNTKNLLKFSLLPYEEVVVQRGTPEFEALVAEGVKSFPVVDVYREDGSRYKRWTSYQPSEITDLCQNRDKVEGEAELAVA